MTSKRILILIVSLVVIFGALTAVYLIVSDKKEAENRKKNAPNTPTQLFNFNTEEVLGLTVKNADGEFSFKYLGTNTWEQTGGEKFDFNPEFLTLIPVNMYKLTSVGTADENPADLSVFGLDNPSVISCFMNDGQNYSIEVGSKSPIGDCWYAKKSGEKAVYKITITAGTILKVTKNNLKNLYFFDVSSRDINYMKLVREGELIHEVSLTDDGWYMNAPVKFKAYLAQCDSDLNMAIRADAINFVEENPKDLSLYGLDKPYAEFTIGSGERRRTAIFSYVNPQTQTCFGLFTDTNEVVQFAYNKVLFFETERLDIMQKFVYEELRLRDITSMSIDYAGRHVELGVSYDEEKSNIIETWGGEPVNTPLLSNRLTYLYNAVQMPQITAIDPNADLDIVFGGEIFMKYAFERLEEPKTVTIEYRKKNATEFYVIRDGEYSGLIARLRDFEQEDGLIPIWKSFEDDNLFYN